MACSSCRSGAEWIRQRSVSPQRVRQGAGHSREFGDRALAGNASAWTKVTEYATTDGVPIVVTIRISRRNTEAGLHCAGTFNVRQTIEGPAGASMIGASYISSIIYADKSWKPISQTGLMRTADAVGNI